MAYLSDRTGAEVDATLDAADTHHANTSNPHSVTKTQVGLGNVDNTSDANKPISTAQAAVNAVFTADIADIERQIKNHSVLDEASGAIEIDFDAEGFRTLTLTANAVFTTLNRGACKSVLIRIICDDTSNAGLTFPAWKFMNAGGTPTSITFPKEALLSLTCYGVNDTDIRAVWLEEP